MLHAVPQTKPNPADHSAQRALVWSEAQSIGSVLKAVEHAGWRVSAVGLPARTRPADLPEGLEELVRYDDPRVALTESGATVALFADPEPVDDPGLRKLADQHNIRLVTLGPSPAGVTAWAHPKEPNYRPGVSIVPQVTESSLYRDALDALEPLGPVMGLSIRLSGPVELGGIGPRVYEAMRVILAHQGIAESVVASCTRTGGTGPPTLRELAGDFHAHIRGTSTNATLAIDDRSAVLRRDISFACAEGTLHLGDTAFSVIDHSGAELDRGASETNALEEGLRAAWEARPAAVQPYDRNAVLAMCEAAVLSARTGGQERPSDLLAMLE